MVPTQPPQNDQYGFYICTAKVQFISGGVRSGKTDIAVKKCYDICTGRHPTLSERFPVPVTGWICAPKYEDNVKQVILKKFQTFCQRKELRGGNWDDAWSERERTLYFANGSRLRFFSFEQGRASIDVFSGADIDFFWCDEHVPRDIYLELLARTVDRNGIAMLTMAPDKGGGITWELDDIVENAPNNPDIAVWFFTTFDNPYLSREGIAQLDRALANDPLRDAKLYGKFVGLAGLVYPMYQRNIHYIPYRELPASFFWVFSINPHLRIPTVWNVGCYGEGTLWVVLEGSFEPSRGGVPELKAAIRASLMKLPKGVRIGLWIGDEAMGGDGLNVFGQPSVLSQLSQGTDGFPIIPTNQSSDKAFEAGVMRIREMLQVDPVTGKPGLYLMQTCPETNKEFERWQFREKTRTDEQLLREHTQTVNKEYLDNIRYMAMAEPVRPGKVTVQSLGAKDPYTGW